MNEKQSDRLLCALFGGLLAIFFFISILKPETGFSEFENRYLGRKPKFSINEVLSGAYMEKYEAYVTDQFPFRNRWITLKTMAERALLKSEINGVYFAADEYYIEKHEKAELFSELSKKNQELLAEFAARQAEYLGKGHVSVMLVPTASCILKEKLPPLAPEDGQEELVSQLSDSYSYGALQGVWTNVYEELLNHKSEELYYHTDHHWTTLGAFYGYTAWKRQRGEPLPDREEYDERCLSDSFTGTLYAKVNIGMKPDRIYAFLKPETSFRLRLDMEGEWRDSFYSYEKLATRDQYAVFGGGNHAVTEIESSAANGKHLLVIKDSYAHCLAPFLAEDFERLTMLDLRYYNGGVDAYIRSGAVTDILVVYNLAGFTTDRFVNKLIK